MRISRRTLLVRACRISAVSTVVLLEACSDNQSAQTCAEQQNIVDNGLRTTLQYTDESDNPAQRCSGCAYFRAASAQCGECGILDASVSANGHCTSWSAKG
jgi:hypothetical protein